MTAVAAPFGGSRPVVVLYCGIPESAWGPHMTLAVAVLAEDAIVLAADGRVSRPELGGLWIMKEDARKLHGVGAFGIGAAGFNGLTDTWLERLRERRLLDGCDDVTRAREVVADMILEYMLKFRDGPAPTGSLLLVGYEADRTTPRVYALHSRIGFQPGDFNWVGTPRGGIAADATALLLLQKWQDRPTREQAKVFACLAVEVAHVADPAVGEPAQLAVVTAAEGFRDCSEEMPALRERAAETVLRLRAAFLEGG